MADACGAEFSLVARALAAFAGAKRRFETRYLSANFRIVDDYGHHPTEIRATIASLQIYKRLRRFTTLHVIWQPHKYSRTIDNLHGFVECFEGVDELVILPI